MKTFVKLFSVLLLAILAIVSCNKVSNARNDLASDSITQDSIVVITPTQVANELLEIKQDIIETDNLLQTFIGMPDDIITHICFAYTNEIDLAYATEYDIARTYIRHKDACDEWYKKYLEMEKFKKHEPYLTIVAVNSDSTANNSVSETN